MHLYQKLIEIEGSINYLLIRGPVPGLFRGVLMVPKLGSLRHDFMKKFALVTARSSSQSSTNRFAKLFLGSFPPCAFSLSGNVCQKGFDILEGCGESN